MSERDDPPSVPSVHSAKKIRAVHNNSHNPFPQVGSGGLQNLSGLGLVGSGRVQEVFRNIMGRIGSGSGGISKSHGSGRVGPGSGGSSKSHGSSRAGSGLVTRSIPTQTREYFYRDRRQPPLVYYTAAERRGLLSSSSRAAAACLWPLLPPQPPPPPPSQFPVVVSLVGRVLITCGPLRSVFCFVFFFVLLYCSGTTARNKYSDSSADRNEGGSKSKSDDADKEPSKVGGLCVAVL